MTTQYEMDRVFLPRIPCVLRDQVQRFYDEHIPVDIPFRVYSDTAGNYIVICPIDCALPVETLYHSIPEWIKDQTA